jgi:hypothetical protein
MPPTSTGASKHLLRLGAPRNLLSPRLLTLIIRFERNRIETPPLSFKSTSVKTTPHPFRPIRHFVPFSLLASAGVAPASARQFPRFPVYNG